MRPTRDEVTTIHDHRGRACDPMLDLGPVPSMFPFRRPELPLDARTSKLLLVALGAWAASLGLMVLLACLAMVAYSGLAWWAFGVLWVPILVGILAAMVVSKLAQHKARIHWAIAGRTTSAALLAARGQCPSCASWLLSTAPDPDRRTTCPTCKVAWKVGNTEGCPGCGYDMSRVPATAGPMAICPECATLSVANRSKEAPE